MAIQIVTLPFDSLVRLSGWDDDPQWAARELLERATYRLRNDPHPDVVAALIAALENGPAAPSRAEAVEEAEIFYVIQEALVRHTESADAPCFPLPFRQTRDSAGAFWRNRWSSSAANWRAPAKARADEVATRWVVNQALPAFRSDLVLWHAMLTTFPLRQHEVQQAVRPVVLELLALDNVSLHRLLTELVGTSLATDLTTQLMVTALAFPRTYPHEAFVVPLIERLRLADGPGETAHFQFEQAQMALVAITAVDSAPRYVRARPDQQDAAQRFWTAWWNANGQGFKAADPARAGRAANTWINRRPS